MEQKQIQQVIHYPRLDTVLMVEDCIRKARVESTRMQLWRSLPKKVQYQTFQLILRYLQESNKIFITKEGRITWVFAETPAALKLLGESVPYARSKTLAGVRRRTGGSAGKSRAR